MRTLSEVHTHVEPSFFGSGVVPIRSPTTLELVIPPSPSEQEDSGEEAEADRTPLLPLQSGHAPYLMGGGGHGPDDDDTDYIFDFHVRLKERHLLIIIIVFLLYRLMKR